MIDREKVIKGLAVHLSNKVPPCDVCPYANFEDTRRYNDPSSCSLSMMADALALLKEQEAVVPILIREGRNKNYNDYVCPRCDNEVVYEQNYCSECGVEFMWEGL